MTEYVVTRKVVCLVAILFTFVLWSVVNANFQAADFFVFSSVTPPVRAGSLEARQWLANTWNLTTKIFDTHVPQPSQYVGQYRDVHPETNAKQITAEWGYAPAQIGGRFTYRRSLTSSRLIGMRYFCDRDPTQDQRIVGRAYPAAFYQQGGCPSTAAVLRFGIKSGIMLDFENVVLHKGVLQLYSPSEDLEWFVSKVLRNQTWAMAGTTISVQVVNSGFDVKSCTSYRNHTAVFQGFHHTDNMHHLMNDNILPLGTNILGHPSCEGGNFVCDPPVVMYELPGKKTLQSRSPNPALWPLMDSVVRERRSAENLLSGGPHCIARLTWGSGPLMNYHNFTATYAKVSKILRKSFFNTIGLAPGQYLMNATTGVSALLMKRRPHGNRYLSTRMRAELREQGRVQGLDVLECCDWTLPLHDVFHSISNASVLMGAHGAGLANLAFSRDGAVMLDFIAVSHNRRWISKFSKIALGVQGSAVFVDPGPCTSNGCDLDSSLVKASVGCTVSILRTGIKGKACWYVGIQAYTTSDIMDWGSREEWQQVRVSLLQLQQNMNIGPQFTQAAGP
mmetsp:Transcript_27672/g.65718  ORF Transcript_27672/g.65718 Transcript_27672/m.65718 type:complete len:562 (+) Transcript_27672:277-1962(+)